jgi:hypothetical protein
MIVQIERHEETPMTRPGVWTWLALLGLSATIVFARPGVVKTKDGQTYDGDIDDKDPDALIVTVKGIKTRIERSRIATVQYPTGTPAQGFADRLARLGPKDVNGRMALAREAFNAHDYATARTAVDQALNIDPNNADAVAFAETIRSQMRLETARTHPPEGAAAAATAPTSEPTTQNSSGQRVLRPQEFNAIRQLELRPDDRAVRIRFERDVRKRFMSYSTMRQGEFNALTPVDQAILIVQKGTPEMRRDVMVLNDPPALLAFRQRVQPTVLQNCATSGCHGARNPKKFSLIEPGDSDAATYTNFYILQKYSRHMESGGDKSVFGRGDLRMLDRQHPEQSMLVQYALPGSQAEYPHPDVPGFKPVFKGKTDPKYLALVDWIGKQLQPVDPDYGIDYPIPGQSDAVAAASQPASSPASAPTPPPPTTRPSPHPPTPPAPRPMRSPTPAPARAAPTPR